MTPRLWVACGRPPGTQVFFYLDGACKVAAGGALWQGFKMSSGIRQWCPLSPMICAACVDLLLRKMWVRFGTPLVQKAFADDVGFILSDFPQQSKRFAGTLAAFGSISCVRVNIPKAIGLPLWPEAEREAGQVLGQGLAHPAGSHVPWVPWPQERGAGVDASPKLV